MGGPLHLFDGYGVELEYMLVDRASLDVCPRADALFAAAGGESESDVDRDDLAWSNELVLHVVELKTNGPASGLDGLAERFQREVAEVNRLAASMGAMLMPTAMHPWMDPARETRLWPHECGPIYQAFDRVFGCRGHGWANLQSTHLNLPFHGDDEFARLHAAIRVVLPLLPALAASSPVVERRVSRHLDARLAFYRHNADRVPLVAGEVIPEAVSSEAEYRERILEPLYASMVPHDPEGILAHEWLNARGAIARFDRGSIEIRLLDIQECPRADLAILRLVVAAVRGLVEECWSSHGDQHAAATGMLAELFQSTVASGPSAPLPAGFARLFGMAGEVATAGAFWSLLAERIVPDEVQPGAPLHVILHSGPLSRRILHALDVPGGRAVSGPTADVEIDRGRLADVYRKLARCLSDGALFDGA